MTPPPPGAGPDDLTARQREVVVLICRGLTNQEIADQMFVSINTVKTLIRLTYAKIGVTSRSRAVLWGFGHGLMPSRAAAERSDAS